MTGPFTDAPEMFGRVTSALDGLTLHASCEYDDALGAPWDEHEGHGPVSDWTSRAKLPGERVLHRDHGSYRYYDFAEAVRIARRDGWGWLPGKLDILPDPGPWEPYEKRGGTARCGELIAYHPTDFNIAIREVYDAHRATMSAKQYAAGAAERDFQRLRAWCENEWCLVGVIVTASKNGIELGRASLWGIESDDEDGLRDVANALAEEAVEEAKVTLSELCECEPA